MKYKIRRFFSGLLLLGAIGLGTLLGLGVLNPADATAAIRQLEEAPGQMVYQSRQSLKDQYGKTWQIIAFKRVRLDGTMSFELRLVGFPGMVEIDHVQPLTLTNSLGKTLTATDDSSNIFAEPAKPEPNIGQYNLQPLLSELRAELPLKITVPTLSSEDIHLSVSPGLVKEWKSVAQQGEVAERE